MNIDFDRLKYSLTGEYEEVMLEKQLKEKEEEIERLKNGCKELEQQIDDLYKLETTLTNENERLNKALQDIKEYIRDEVAVFAFSEVGNMNLAHLEFNDDNVEHILDIVNKALGSDKE